MASPNEVFTEMVTTTLRNHPSEIADNVSNHNALYRRMRERNRVQKQGGYEIVMPLAYAENGTYQRYSGYDQLNIQASDVLTAAKFDWVQAAISVTASGRELRMNRSKEQIINLVRSRIDNARRTAANNMAVDLYSTGSLANQIGGLAHIITDAGTGIVGGINSTTETWWRNKFREATGNAAKTTIAGDMNALWLQLVRGTDKPDLIVASHDLYSLYWEGLTDLQRYGPAQTTGGATMETLKFKSADVIFDNNSNFLTTAEKMYFLNTDYLMLVEHPEASWAPQPERRSVNQDAEVVLMTWMGNLCCSNRSLQGVLFDAVDS